MPIERDESTKLRPTLLIKALIALLIAIGLCLLLYFQFLLPGYQGLKASEWKTTTGTLLSAEVVETKDSSGESRKPYNKPRYSYSLNVEYEYMVDGKKYRGNRFALFETNHSLAELPALQEFVKRHKPNSKIEVFYLPDNPENSVLDTYVDWRHLIIFTILLSGAVFVALFAAKFYFFEYLYGEEILEDEDD